MRRESPDSRQVSPSQSRMGLRSLFGGPPLPLRPPALDTLAHPGQARASGGTFTWSFSLQRKYAKTQTSPCAWPIGAGRRGPRGESARLRRRAGDGEFARGDPAAELAWGFARTRARSEAAAAQVAGGSCRARTRRLHPPSSCAAHARAATRRQWPGTPGETHDSPAATAASTVRRRGAHAAEGWAGLSAVRASASEWVLGSSSRGSDASRCCSTAAWRR
eukprot:scaffold2045_cov404-Prasinococcus_capsulatus_cf.AAC.46